MFHMLSCFDLKGDTTIEEFTAHKKLFAQHMEDRNLVHSTSPIGRRNKHPVMDTDSERDQEYFFTMSFLDEEQCNQAVKLIYSHQDSKDTSHLPITLKVDNAIFICWEDIE